LSNTTARPRARSAAAAACRHARPSGTTDSTRCSTAASKTPCVLAKELHRVCLDEH